MTKYGHTINHPGENGDDNESNKRKFLHEKEMDVLPIPMNEQIKALKINDSIARTEHEITRSKREAVTKGNLFLSQLPKALEKGDQELALTILAAARRQFKRGGEEKMESEVNALHVKIKGDHAIANAKKHRIDRDYASCVSEISSALYHFKVLSGITQVFRETNPTDAYEKEKDQRKWLQIKDPEKYVRKLAIRDGEESRSAAVAMLEERNYEGSREKVEDARICFKWANLSESETGVEDLDKQIGLAQSTNFGDNLLEEIARSMKPVVRKDFAALYKELEQAQNAYDSAYDKAGVKVTMRMKKCLLYIREGDVAWISLVQALRNHDYGKAVECLITARKSLWKSANGLPQINSDLDIIVGVILNEKLPSSVMIAEMAMEDAEALKKQATSAKQSEDLEQTMIYVKKAKKCYEWILQRKTMLINSRKEDFGLGESDANETEANAATLTNIDASDEVLAMNNSLMQRFINKFSGMEKESLVNGFVNVTESIRELDEVTRGVGKRNAMRDGDTFLAEADAEPDAEKKAELLSRALNVYSSNNFMDQVKHVSTLRSNLLGNLSFEKAVKFIEEKNYSAAQGEITNSLKHFKSTKNIASYKKINNYWLCAQGDRLLSQYHDVLGNGDYDQALSLGSKVVGLYNESSDEKRVSLIGDPEVTVKARAKSDALAMKAEALKLLDECNLTTAREKALSAQSCLEWSGDCTTSITDILSVIKLADYRLKGDEALKTTESVYSEKDRPRSYSTLATAKSHFVNAQELYRNLMARAASMLENEINEDGEDPVEALDLQDNIIKQFNVRVDGAKLKRVESIERTLAADAELDNIGKLLKSELFDEAKAQLLATRNTYGDEGEIERVKKCDIMLELVKSGSDYFTCIQDKQFPEAKVHIVKAKDILDELEKTKPFAIKELEGTIFGTQSAMDTVVDRALSSSLEEQEEARAFLDAREFSPALKKCDKAMASYNWVASGNGMAVVAGLISKLNVLVKEIKRKGAYVDGETAYNKAVDALAIEPKPKYQVAILALTSAEDFFVKAEDESKVQECKVLKSKTTGRLYEVQAKDFWKAGNLNKALDKCQQGIEFFKNGGDETKARILGRFLARVKGDIEYKGYEEAISNSMWDEALEIMVKTFAYYDETQDVKLLSTFEGVKPRAKVVEEALKEGENLKMQAQGALIRKGDFVEAQEKLELAKACFAWCDWSFTKAGINMIQKDIDSATMKTEAEAAIDTAFEKFSAGETAVCVRLIEEAVVKFKKGGASIASAAFNSQCILEGIKASDGMQEVARSMEAEDWKDAMDKIIPVVNSWSVVAGISAVNSTSIGNFIKYFGVIEHQLKGVWEILKKYHMIVEECKKNKWNKPTALGEEIGVLMGGLEAGEWSIQFDIQLVKKVVRLAEIECGIYVEPVAAEPEVEEPVIAEPEVEEPVVAEPEVEETEMMVTEKVEVGAAEDQIVGEDVPEDVGGEVAAEEVAAEEVAAEEVAAEEVAAEEVAAEDVQAGEVPAEEVATPDPVDDAVKRNAVQEEQAPVEDEKKEAVEDEKKEEPDPKYDDEEFEKEKTDEVALEEKKDEVPEDEKKEEPEPNYEDDAFEKENSQVEEKKD